jgi:hypothetical protein
MRSQLDVGQVETSDSSIGCVFEIRKFCRLPHGRGRPAARFFRFDRQKSREKMNLPELRIFFNRSSSRRRSGAREPHTYTNVLYVGRSTCYREERIATSAGKWESRIQKVKCRKINKKYLVKWQKVTLYVVLPNCLKKHAQRKHKHIP